MAHVALNAVPDRAVQPEPGLEDDRGFVLPSAVDVKRHTSRVDDGIEHGRRRAFTVARGKENESGEQ